MYYLDCSVCDFRMKGWYNNVTAHFSLTSCHMSQTFPSVSLLFVIHVSWLGKIRSLRLDAQVSGCHCGVSVSLCRDWTCVLGVSWQMMLSRCRSHRDICGRGGTVLMHVNEPRCQSCMITARTDTNHPHSPQRPSRGGGGERGDAGGSIILEKTETLCSQIILSMSVHCLWMCKNWLLLNPTTSHLRWPAESKTALLNVSTHKFCILIPLLTNKL